MRLSHAVNSMTCLLITSKGKIPVNVIIDSGSNTSNIDESLIKELGLKPSTEEFDRTVRYVSTTATYPTAGYDLQFVSPDNHHTQSVTAFRVQNFNSVIPNWYEVCKTHKYLENLPIIKPKNNVAKILLGTDCPSLFQNLENISSQNEGPTATRNILGWSFLGKFTPNNLAPNVSKTFKQEVENLVPKKEKTVRLKSYDSELNDLVKRSMELESWDLAESDRPFSKKFKGGPKPIDRWTDEEHIAFEKMKIKQVTNTVDKNFVANVPWKDGHTERLKGNFAAVRKRQDTTLSPKALEKKGIKIEEIQSIFDGYIKKGYIVEVPENQWEDGWYLPFFCVVNRSKTTPVRPVFDAKAQFNKVSLNNQILNTPNLLNDTWPTLLHLRQYKYALTGDISEMFLRVRLAPEDQKYHRFYFDGKVYQWTRILFGNTSSPNISQKVIRAVCDKYESKFPVAARYIRKWCYMDDAIASSPTESELKLLAEQLPQLLLEADMKMGKFYSNSVSTLSSIPEDLRAKEVQVFSDRDTIFDQSKVLGMIWDAKEDVLKFKSKFKSVNEWKEHLKIESWTKRTILKTTASTYDPLGFLSAITVQARAVIQKLWLLDLDWDQQIPVEIEEEWVRALENLINIESIKIPRWIGLTPESDSEIHIFCDASELVYCVAAYCRVNSVGGPVVNLITAKARVTPIKNESISRLELVACVLGTRLARAITDVYETPKEKIHFWTDSRNSLHWINTPPKKVKVYVQNRTGEIQRTTDPIQWHHIPTDQNPADIPTRPIPTDELVGTKLWWHGPDILRSNDPYPNFVVSNPSEEALLEYKDDNPLYFQANYQVDRLGHSVGKLKNGYERAIRIFLAIINGLNRAFVNPVPDHEKRQRAHEYLIKISQYKSFQKEIEFLQKYPDKQLPQKSELFKLCPFLDEKGILRTKTRLQSLKFVSYDQAFPIILTGTCYLARTILEDYHRKYHHTVSFNSMMATLFKKYHFIHLTSALKKIIKNCLRCRRNAAKKVPTLMAPLKKNIEQTRPFYETGIDFAGPFSVKVGRGKIRKQMYVLVLTCMNTRCTHFEICEDQKTSSVLNALTRFSNLRGAPAIIKSDNQTSFVSTRKELSDFVNNLDHSEIIDSLQKEFENKTQWIFIPARAPHFGGSWEIMVKAMKRAVEVITEGQDVSEDEFRTVISKAAALLNSRPLTKTMLEEKEVILTPNSFLIGTYVTTDFDTTKVESKESNLTLKYREVLKLEKEVWKQFIREILPEISPRTKWQKIFPELKVNDLVLVIENGIPKGQWKMAIVVETKKSIDGIVRSAVVRINDKLYSRPVIDLFPLFEHNS